MKAVLVLLVVTVLICLGSQDSAAQLPSVVQLPTFHTFSYRGSVLVPDGGTTSLGGVKRSAIGYSRRGWNRGYGSVQSNAQASVSANIIDLNEMDRQILGASPQEFLRRARAQELAGLTRGTVPRLTLSNTDEGKALVRFARQEYQAGRKSSAFNAYSMAIDKLDGRLRSLAEVEFRRVYGAAAEQKLRMASLRR